MDVTIYYPQYTHIRETARIRQQPHSMLSAEGIINSKMNENERIMSSLPVRCGGLGVKTNSGH